MSYKLKLKTEYPEPWQYDVGDEIKNIALLAKGFRVIDKKGLDCKQKGSYDNEK